MTIPSFSEIPFPFLDFVSDKKTHVINDVVNYLADFFKLSKEDRTKLKPSSDREPLFNNRVHWAKYYLKQARLLESPKKGEIKITNRGLNLLKKGIKEMDRTYLIKISLDE